MQLFVIDISDGRWLEIPRLSRPSALASSTASCGIHSISVSPGRQYVATGGHHPNYLALYHLPHILPLALGEVRHQILVLMYSIHSYLLLGSYRLDI